nr:MAG TPA: Terminase large subunit [Caudoviricetes sp.]
MRRNRYERSSYLGSVPTTSRRTDVRGHYILHEGRETNGKFIWSICISAEEQPVTAYPFQCFILGSLNGWRTKDGHHRRFRTSYIQLGRQNGKSFLNGILAAYYGNFDKYKYGQVYCTATKKDQAMIVFNEIVKFINSDSDLSECFKIHEHNSTIDCKITHSKIKALSGDTKSIDGFRPYLGIVDEYHAHKDDQMYKLLEGGIKKMKSALISVITTAGFDLKSPCFALYEYCVKVLKGVASNDSQFIYIAQMNESDDMWTPENWIKANPILEYDRDALQNMIPIAATAKEMGGSTLRDFIVKQLNMWIQWTNDVYIKDMDVWTRAAVKKTLADFRGQKAYVGLDLSSGGDLTSIAIVIPFMQGEDKCYFVHAHSFIPKRRVEEHIKTDRVPYDLWIRQGLVEVTETMGGVKTDYKYIIAYLKKIVKLYELDVQWICYDPHNASAFLTDLEALGFDSIAVKQSARELNDPTVDFRLELEAGHVEHDGNEAMKWSIANAKTTSNSFGEIKIDKEYTTERIDIVDAIIDAWMMAMKGEIKPDVNRYLDIWFAGTEKLRQKGGAQG